MASVFSKIIGGEFPGRFVWADEHCVGFLTIEPQTHGHVLVVPRQEIDHWIDLPDDLRDHLFGVAQQIGAALLDEFEGDRIGLVIAGYGVPHTHLHVFPVTSLADFDQTNPMRDLPDDVLDRDAERVRDALRACGVEQVVGSGALDA